MTDRYIVDLAGTKKTTFKVGNVYALLTSRNINTTAGELTGGGDLSADRTLGLAATTVVAGTYGSAAVIPEIVVDAKGRLTTVTNRTITPAGIGASALGHTHVPADITGFYAYGITGTKSLTGGGTLAADRTMELVNDLASPGNTQYYGTNGSGTKGWFSLLGQNLVGLETAGITGLLTLTKAGTTPRTLTAPDATGTIRLVEDIYAFLALNTSSGAPAYGEGKLYWDSNDHTLALMTEINGVTLQVGQEEVVRARNQTGSLISNGQVVYVNGASGSRPTIALALATSVLSDKVIGICTYDIANNAVGYVTRGGLVRDMDTFAWAEGTELYVSDSVAGGLTSTPPVAPNHAVRVGVVLYSHAVNGIVMVHVDTGNSLNDLHDVYLAAPANKNALRYVTANNRWENTNQGAWLDTAQSFSALQTLSAGAIVSDLTSTYMVVAGASGRLANSAIIQGSITGAMTINKTGVTARAYTFPDVALTVAGFNGAPNDNRVPYASGGILATSSSFNFDGSSGLSLGAATGTVSPSLSLAAGNSGTGVAKIKLGTAVREWEVKVGASPYTFAIDYVGTDAPLANILTLTKGGAASFLGAVTCSSTLSCTSITASGLTSGGIAQIGTGGLLSYAGWMKWDTGTFFSQGAIIGDGTANAGIAICGLGPANSSVGVQFCRGGAIASKRRWFIGTDILETGVSDVGGRFFLNAYNDAGTFIDTPMQITRASGGAMVFGRPVQCSSTLSATSLTATGLTSGCVPFVTTGGLLTNDAGLLYGSFLLTVGDGTANAYAYLNGAAGNTRQVRYLTNGTRRWVAEADGTAEGGADAGTKYLLSAYNDAGTFIDSPISIVRAAGGAITLARPVTCTGAVTVPNGTAAAPGIRLTTDASGLYRPSAGVISVSASGVLVASFVTPNGTTSGGGISLNSPSVAEVTYIASSRTDGMLYVTGGTGSANSGNVRLYGSTHATKASYIEFLRANTVSAYFDGSGNLFCSGSYVQVPNGTAAAPGIRLTSEAHGLYRDGATSIGFAVAGVYSAKLSSSGSLTTVGGIVAGSTITANLDGLTLGNTSAGTANKYIRITNDGAGFYLGIERSAGGSLLTGASAYATVFGTSNATALQFGSNGVVRMQVNSGGEVVILSALNIGLVATAQVQSTAGRILLSSSATDVTTKATFIVNAHYTNAEEPFGTILASSNAATNLLMLGGGSGSYNAATSVSIYTGATSTTVTGTDRFNVDANGIITISNATDASSTSNGSVRLTGGLSVLLSIYSGGIGSFRKDQDGDTYVRVYNAHVGTSAMARFAVNTADRSGQLSCHSSTAAANTGYLALIADSATNLMLSAAGAAKHIALLASSGEVARFDVDGLTIASTKSIITPASTSYHYFGPAGTDGSVRVYGNGSGALIVEKRVSGSWVEAGRFA